MSGERKTWTERVNLYGPDETVVAVVVLKKEYVEIAEPPAPRPGMYL